MEVAGAVFTVELEEADLFPESGQEVLIYYNRKREFVKHSARIGTLSQTEADADGVTKVRVEFETFGLPVSAEGRQCYRVSTVVSGLRFSTPTLPTNSS